jgi:hypothetical protein
MTQDETQVPVREARLEALLIEVQRTLEPRQRDLDIGLLTLLCRIEEEIGPLAGREVSSSGEG